MGEVTWFEKLGFEENPLDVRPNPRLIGLEAEQARLTNHIRKGEICFLNGPTGSGKTSMLRKIQNELEDHSFIYLNAEDLPRDFDLEGVIRGKRDFLEKITFKRYPKKTPVLLIDEFQATDPNLVLEAKGKWETSKGVKGVVIAQISRQLKNVSGSFRDRIGKRIINFKSLDADELRAVLKGRLLNMETGVNYFDRLSEETVNLLISCADSTPRRLLEYADIIFDFHHTKFKDKNPLLEDGYQVSYHAARDILEFYGAFKDDGKNKAATPDEIAAGLKEEAPVIAFSEKETDILFFLKAKDVATTKSIAKGLGLKTRTVGGTIAALRKKKAVILSGKQKGANVWEIAPNIKRQLVQV